MKKEETYAEMGLRALKRAARAAWEEARRNNLKIPIWNNGRVEYVVPEAENEKGDLIGPDIAQTGNP